MRTRNIIIIIVVVNVAWGGFYLATTTPSLAWSGDRATNRSTVRR